MGENSPMTELFPFCFSFLGERCVETGVPGLLMVLTERGGPGESTPVLDLESAGLLLRGDGKERLDVLLMGELGLGLCTATGTLADRVA